jgi:hypothetical protein
VHFLPSTPPQSQTTRTSSRPPNSERNRNNTRWNCRRRFHFTHPHLASVAGSRTLVTAPPHAAARAVGEFCSMFMRRGNVSQRWYLRRDLR